MRATSDLRSYERRVQRASDEDGRSSQRAVQTQSRHYSANPGATNPPHTAPLPPDQTRQHQPLTRRERYESTLTSDPEEEAGDRHEDSQAPRYVSAVSSSLRRPPGGTVADESQEGGLGDHVVVKGSTPRESLHRVDLGGRAKSLDQRARPDSDDIEFSFLKGSAKYFASIPDDDFEQRAAFMTQHPDLFDVDFQSFLREAVRQVLNKDILAVTQCIKSMVILRQTQKFRTKSKDQLKAHVLAMDKRGTQQNKDFSQMYEDVCRTAQKAAVIEEQKQRAPPREELAPRHIEQDVEPTQTATKLHTHRQKDSKMDWRGRQDAAGELQSIRGQEKRQRHDSKRNSSFDDPLVAADKDTADIMDSTDAAVKARLDVISSAPVGPVRMEDMVKIRADRLEAGPFKTLSAKYVLKNGKFFAAGAVFAVLWHEAVGESLPEATIPEYEKAGEQDLISKNMSIGAYGEKIFSHVRRMVVIRNREGYCWCLPINSYGGQGIKKPGLKKVEREAHTIIYDSKYETAPQPLADEPPIRKRPIPVVMSKGQTLNRASRLHYGKPYSIDWNTKIMPVGQVVKNFLPVLLAEAAAELFPESKDSTKPQQ